MQLVTDRRFDVENRAGLRVSPTRTGVARFESLLELVSLVITA